MFRAILVFLILQVSVFPVFAEKNFTSEKHSFIAETIVSGLENPWALDFLPDGRVIVTEKPGTLRLVSNGKLSAPISGVPEVNDGGQGGLLDVLVDPGFKENQRIFLSYSGNGKGGVSTEVISAKLLGNELTQVKKIFVGLPKSRGGYHYGSRLLLDTDGTLFISLGDRGEMEKAQDRSDHAGSLIRINTDGTVPKDNPFVNQNNIRPEIYTWGNRNMQGMAMHPHTGAVWTIEHGPQGGDELNLMRAGHNYGWPVITYGVNYVIGTKIGEGTEKPGMEQPVHYWVPSIATSGMAFYTGTEFPEWQGNLFVGSLKFGLLVRLEMEGNNVVHEERMLKGQLGRIRDVKQGPDGSIYLVTDESNGKLIRLKNN